MQHGPFLGCHHRIAERKDRTGYLLTELVTLAKDRDHVTRPGKLQREADCRTPITAIDYLGLQVRSTNRTPGPVDQLGPDRAWIFGSGIVIGCNHYVGVVSCRLPHRLPFLRISVSAATEYDDATTGSSGLCWYRGGRPPRTPPRLQRLQGGGDRLWRMCEIHVDQWRSLTQLDPLHPTCNLSLA